MPTEAELVMSVLRNSLLISGYLSHLPSMLSAMEVSFRLSNFKICFEIYWGRPAIQTIPILIVFQGGHPPTFKIFKIVVISTLIDLYMLQILFS